MADIDRIRVSGAEVESAIAKFNSCKEQMAAATGQMAVAMASVNSSWDGAASEAYVNQFSEVISNLATNDGQMEQLVKALQDYLQIHDQNEGGVSGMMSGLSEATPFNG